jgi:predicted PurR-regulated permease PerM
VDTTPALEIDDTGGAALPPQPGAATMTPAGWAERSFPGLVLLSLTAFALFLCYLMARPFITSLAWATALAVLGWPIQRWLARRLRSRSVAALCAVFALAVLLILPAVMLAPQVITEGIAGFRLLEAQIEAGTWDATIARYEPIRPWWEWLQARVDLADFVRYAGTLLTAAGTLAVKASVVGVVQFALVFFFLFYLLRDRDVVLAAVRSMLPLTKAETDHVLRAAGDTIIATVWGKVAVGIVQGTLGGAMFWWLDLPAAWFWAILMAVLSIVPLLGAPLVWAPAAVLLAIDGQWLHAAILAGWGAVVVGLADNLLYPLVVGRFLHMHTVPLLIALIGGIIVFGAAGFFVGPAVLAITVAVLQVWRDRASAAAAA